MGVLGSTSRCSRLVTAWCFDGSWRSVRENAVTWRGIGALGRGLSPLQKPHRRAGLARTRPTPRAGVEALCVSPRCKRITFFEISTPASGGWYHRAISDKLTQCRPTGRLPWPELKVRGASSMVCNAVFAFAKLFRTSAALPRIPRNFCCQIQGGKAAAIRCLLWHCCAVDPPRCGTGADRPPGSCIATPFLSSDFRLERRALIRWHGRCFL